MDKKTLEAILDKKLDPINVKVRETNLAVEDLMKSIKFMSSQYDDMIKKLEEVEKINKDVIEENERLKAELLRTAN
jgi:hypothetical protein